ncbi:SPOR domain-containing protein [Legionella sp. 31fI33]|uniref:outer membrane beta-barrel protein n=2 Tax=unclassified Legionella TaxID=2622702 RepID=UPI001E6510A3|nr:SPOR domain-containing protein [Legionella sp. 31fI33]MCC5014295.1 outer membrane beta-barrel protein [Legionella sp. 31fI33]
MDLILLRINPGPWTLSLLLTLFSCCAISTAWSSQVIYGTQNAVRFVGNPHKKIYFLQLGAFSNKSNAQTIARKIKSKTQFPVTITPVSTMFAVRIGPLNAQELHQLGAKFSGNLKQCCVRKPIVPHQQTHQVQVNPPRLTPAKTAKNVKATTWFTSSSEATNSWYLTAKIGAQRTHVDDQLTVDNGSGFSSPSDKDTYTMDSESSAVLGVGGGYRFTHFMVPAVSVGINYSHFFNRTINGQIRQYSLPEFTNYNYQWKLSSDLVLASSKINLLEIHHVAPFVQGGIGVSINHASDYSETVLPNVTPRVSPGFSNHNQTSFAYQLGAGLDWAVKPQWLVSLGYEYTDLGKFRSGPGLQEWSNATLSSRNLTSNAAVFGMTYLFHG